MFFYTSQTGYSTTVVRIFIYLVLIYVLCCTEEYFLNNFFFIYFIGVLCQTQDYFTHTHKHYGGRKKGSVQGSHDHLLAAAKPSHLQLEKKPAKADLELTETELLRDSWAIAVQ